MPPARARTPQVPGRRGRAGAAGRGVRRDAFLRAPRPTRTGHRGRGGTLLQSAVDARPRTRTRGVHPSRGQGGRRPAPQDGRSSRGATRRRARGRGPRAATRTRGPAGRSARDCRQPEDARRYGGPTAAGTAERLGRGTGAGHRRVPPARPAGSRHRARAGIQAVGATRLLPGHGARGETTQRRDARRRTRAAAGARGGSSGTRPPGRCRTEGRGSTGRDTVPPFPGAPPFVFVGARVSRTQTPTSVHVAGTRDIRCDQHLSPGSSTRSTVPS